MFSNNIFCELVLVFVLMRFSVSIISFFRSSFNIQLVIEKTLADKAREVLFN